MRRFLERIDRTGYIYSRRWGDLIVQSVAVQAFLPKRAVHMFDDFTYAHATPARVGRGGRDGGGGAQCIAFGGVAAGSDDPRGLQTVARFVRGRDNVALGGGGNVSGAGESAPGGAKVLGFCEPPCVRTYVRAGRLVAAATAGLVTVERPGCDREPVAYYCRALPLHVGALAG